MIAAEPDPLFGNQLEGWVKLVSLVIGAISFTSAAWYKLYVKPIHDQMDRWVDGESKLATVREVNALGQIVNEIKLSCAQTATRMTAGEREQSTASAERRDLIAAVGGLKADVRLLSDGRLEESTKIISHINDARHEASEQSAMVRERLAGLEAKSQVLEVIKGILESNQSQMRRQEH